MPAEQPTSSKLQYIPALDGLRGIAILLVIFYHNFNFIKPSAIGWLGVDLFFVLSGYLITSILLDSLGRPGFLKNFYIRRALRIFPLYYLFVFFFLYIFPLFGEGSLIQYYKDNQVYLWTFTQNWLYAFNFPANANLLNHLWSLGVEEQFYLFWPLLILIVKKPRALCFCMLAILLTVISIRIGLLLNNPTAQGPFYPFTRVDGLCIGSIVALLHRMNINFLTKYMAFVVLGVAILNYSFYFLNIRHTHIYPYYFFVGYTTFTALFGLLVHEIVMNKTRIISAPLSFAPLRFIGRISYGFYLYHWPCFVLLTPLFKNALDPHLRSYPAITQLLYSLLSTLAAFVISVISFYGFERKFLLLKGKFR